MNDIDQALTYKLPQRGAGKRGEWVTMEAAAQGYVWTERMGQKKGHAGCLLMLLRQPITQVVVGSATAGGRAGAVPAPPPASHRPTDV